MAQKISVIIPNYNGLNLLQKNLPSVIKNCPNCQIIVVDDASSDKSVEFLKENFKKIKIIVHPKNKGFVGAVNSGIRAATGQYVLLLNSDVSPRENFLLPLKAAIFDNPNVFAVGIKDISHEDGRTITKGRGGARFKKGFVNHYPLPVEKGETLWVSGGSGIFNKSALINLGAFDSLYAPFYWEDIDLSYRARKSGLICMFEPDSVVDHYHEKGAIKSYHSDFFIKTISYKNQFIFIWKNISDYFLLSQHILWQPYHFIRAFINYDWAFFIGFFKAALQIPRLVINYHLRESEFTVSDKEIFKKFEKQ